ncbi:MAG: DUF3375 domain-containing protein, partial [Spirochaetaceae bacterium]|nr:DUF3375 domain-containing protein [Spirochaetaceae bacterium]
LVFRENNLRRIEESDLVMHLEDFLFNLDESGNDQKYPRSAGEYLDEWARNDRGWLRKFYPVDSDSPHYDITPATEKALQWMESLFDHSFIGTEGRLFAGFELLRQIVHGVETDRKKRIKELNQQKKRIDREIKAIESGEVPLLDGREIRERFIQFTRIARELLSDFRTVEHNFRELDRTTREGIAGWSGEKGGLLERFFGEHDKITSSDQGQSFRAFWDFMMSSESQDELSQMLDRVFELDELDDLLKDDRLRRIHFDWLAAGDQTQRVVARLSRQLRRYLDDRSYLENKRIIQLLGGIERKALDIREEPPEGVFIHIDGFRPDIKLPMERPLFSPPVNVKLDSRIILDDENVMVDISALYNQVIVDKNRLKGALREILEEESQVTLPDILDKNPLEEGLVELIVWFTLAEESSHAFIDDSVVETVCWQDKEGTQRSASIPRVLFQRKNLNESA